MQYIPGIDQQLGPAMEQFMAGLNHAIDPNFKMREAVKEQMAINPELLQNLANAEAKSPGTLSRLGLGKIGDIAASTPADIATQNEINNRPALLEDAKSKTAADTAVNKLTAQKATAGSTTLADPNSTASKEIGNLASVGMTSWQMANDEQKAEYAKFTKQIISDGTAITVKKLENGEYTPQQMIGIFNSPLGEGLKIMTEADNEKYRRALMNRQITADNAMNRLMEGQAFKLFQDTRVGSPQAFLALMKNPERAAQLAANPELAKTSEDKALVEAQNGINQLNAADRAKQTADVNRNINAAILAFRTIKPNDPNADELKTTAAQSLNEAFAARSAVLGMPKYTVSYDKIKQPWYRSDTHELIFNGEDGKAVPENTAMNGFASNPQFNQLVNRAQSDLMKAQALGPQAYMTALNTIKQKNPEVYSAIIARSTAANKAP